jgi:hypothetical protein
MIKPRIVARDQLCEKLNALADSVHPLICSLRHSAKFEKSCLQVDDSFFDAHFLPRFLLAFSAFTFGGLPIFGGSNPSRSLSGISQTGPRAVSSLLALGKSPCLHHRLTVDLPTPKRSAAFDVVSSLAAVSALIGFYFKPCAENNQGKV